MKEKKRKKMRKTLYQQFLDRNAERKEKERLQEELKTEEIVIKRISAGGKLLELLSEWLYRFFRFIFVLLITVLVSVGVTVIVNSSLRNAVIEILKKSF